MNYQARTRGRVLAPTAVALGALAVWLPATAGAQAADEPVTPAEASVQLDQAVAALSASDPAASSPTTELRDLALALPALEGRERRQARAILARPPSNDGAGLDDAGGVEPFGAEWSTAATNTRQAYLSPGGRFLVHWVEVSSDAPDIATDLSPLNGVPDYVDQVAARADTSAAVENGSLGWPQPKSDGARGGGSGITDIYLADICGDQACVFGYAGPDDRSSTCRRPPYKCFAYLVLDNDYAPDEFEYSDPDIPLSVTMAHEYNHVLQFRLDAQQDGWTLEATAVWAEEQVFPDADDWLFYVRAWARQPQAPITNFGAGGGLRVYGSAVWNHWLDLGAGYGPDVILDSWRRSRSGRPRGNGIAAFNRGIRKHGGPGFAQEFGRFAAATAEWRLATGDFPDQDEFPDVNRQGTLRQGGGADAFALDHTAYRLLRVRSGGANRVRLRVKAPRGVRATIALVGRDGGAETGSAVTRLRNLKRGGRRGVSIGGARGFERITAVVVNTDGRLRHGTYTRDNKRFRVAIR